MLVKDFILNWKLLVQMAHVSYWEIEILTPIDTVTERFMRRRQDYFKKKRSKTKDKVRTFFNE